MVSSPRSDSVTLTFPGYMHIYLFIFYIFANPYQSVFIASEESIVTEFLISNIIHFYEVSCDSVDRHHGL